MLIWCDTKEHGLDSRVQLKKPFSSDFEIELFAPSNVVNIMQTMSIYTFTVNDTQFSHHEMGMRLTRTNF